MNNDNRTESWRPNSVFLIFVSDIPTEDFIPRFSWKGQKVISFGRSTPVADVSTRFGHLPSIHAEYDCLRKCPRLETRRKQSYTLVVYRYDNHGQLKNSRPCHHCLLLLKRVGIHRVRYSTDKGEFIEERVQDMEVSESYVSLGWKIRHFQKTEIKRMEDPTRKKNKK